MHLGCQKFDRPPFLLEYPFNTNQYSLAIENVVAYSLVLPSGEVINVMKAHSHLDPLLHQQNMSGTVTCCISVAINCHRYVPLLHRCGHSIAVAWLVGSVPGHCALGNLWCGAVG